MDPVTPPSSIADLSTPALVVDLDALDANIARMGALWPGTSLRPHVKAFKSTALARRLAEVGHQVFCTATIREAIGLAEAGLGTDVLVANEIIDPRRLRDAVEAFDLAGGRLTLAVDSPETVTAAAAAGVREVLIDVEVGMPRCGCHPDDAASLADAARAAGLEVRGVMGYEGHLMAEPDDRRGKTASAMALLISAHEQIGGDVISGGGTGTWDCNPFVTELQAGSFTLMDTHYEAAGVGFAPALTLLATVVSVNRRGGWAVADAGLKALGMDHGNPAIEGAAVWFCSDEHTTFSMRGEGPLPSVGDRVSIRPAHVDPTVACHERLWVARGDAIVDCWEVDLRNW